MDDQMIADIHEKVGQILGKMETLTALPDRVNRLEVRQGWLAGFSAATAAGIAFIGSNLEKLKNFL